MSDYTPTTEEVRDLWGYHSRYLEFDAWLASVKADAWSEGWSARASRGYAHLKVGECVPPPAHINPYRQGETE